MKGVPRYIVKKSQVKDIAGEPMLMHVFSDMADEDLAKAMTHFQEQEDYEYCDELLHEAHARGLPLMYVNDKEGTVHYFISFG